MFTHFATPAAVEHVITAAEAAAFADFDFVAARRARPDTYAAAAAANGATPEAVAAIRGNWYRDAADVFGGRDACRCCGRPAAAHGAPC